MLSIDVKLNDPAADNRKWSVEIKLPMRSLKECSDCIPKPGDYWRVNFSRVQWTCEVIDGEYRKVLGPDGRPLPEDNWVWAPTGVVDIHRPQYWGFLFFTENGEEYPIPEDGVGSSASGRAVCRALILLLTEISQINCRHIWLLRM